MTAIMGGASPLHKIIFLRQTCFRERAFQFLGIVRFQNMKDKTSKLEHGAVMLDADGAQR